MVSRDRYRFKMSSYPGINFTRMVTGSSEQRRELGEFVRAHRERLTPAAIGLPAGSRRRTPGLRREEVAQLCGLSATWYSWIEQGRDVSVSPTALARLAVALRLGRAERAYLFELAGKRDPEHGRGESERHTRRRARLRRRHRLPGLCARSRLERAPLE